MKLRINPKDIPSWQRDESLMNKNTKMLSQLIFGILSTFIHDNTLKISFSMNELFEDVRDVVDCNNQFINDTLDLLFKDGVVSKVK